MAYCFWNDEYPPPHTITHGATAKDKMRSKGGSLAGQKIMNDNLGEDFTGKKAESILF